MSSESALYDRLISLVLTDSDLLAKLPLVLTTVEADCCASALVSISLLYKRFQSFVYLLLEHEFESHRNEQWSILRGNSLVCKILDAYTRRSAKPFLPDLLGTALRQIVEHEEISFEIDPGKIRGGADGNPALVNLKLTENEHALNEFCTTLLDIITAEETIASMPNMFKNIAGMIGALAKDYQFDDVPLIGGYIMLRLINPSITLPEKFGIVNEPVKPAVRRNLILASKVLQNLSNSVLFGQKESYMERMNPFIESNMFAMREFLKTFHVSSVDELLADEEGAVNDPNSEDGRSAVMQCIEDAREVHRILAQHQEALGDPEVSSILSEMVHLLPAAQGASASSSATLNPSASGSVTVSASGSSTSSSSSSASTQPSGPSSSSQSQPPDQQHAAGNADDAYLALLRKSYTVNLSDIEEMRFLQRRGTDDQGRPVMLFIAENLKVHHADMDRVLMYVIREMDRFVECEYALVYCHTNFHSENKPEFSFMRRVYQLFNRKYKKNLKAFYIVHPTFWVKLTFKLFRPLISSKFTKKLVYIDRISQLGNAIPGIVFPYTICAHDFVNCDASRPCVPYFGQPLVPDSQEAPYVFDQCVRYIQSKGMGTEGIFRLAPALNELAQLREVVDRGYPVDFSTIADPHLVAGLLKQFLRDLPEPLMPYDIVGNVQEIVLGYNASSQEDRLLKFQSLLCTHLPVAHAILLYKLIGLLKRIQLHSQVNRMTVEALSICIGPCILRAKDASPLEYLKLSPIFNKATEILISHFDFLFENDAFAEIVRNPSLRSLRQTVRQSSRFPVHTGASVKEADIQDMEALQAMLMVSDMMDGEVPARQPPTESSAPSSSSSPSSLSSAE
eukprot:ANDGO_01286.mRNA.1 Rho GTPase-activating protein gacY